MPPWGYGQVGVDGKLELVHRVAWTLVNGEIPEGLIIRHACDNPPCVNPAHLLVGTFADNSQDAVDRDRLPYGDSHPHTVIGDEQVREILRRFVPGRGGNRHELAAEFGVTAQHITDIAGGRERFRVQV